MMMNNDHKIIQLDKEISNKIAAGEVVERPLAVVKELVENAIDAGASKITVEVQDAGKSMIRITDNGRGLHPSDIVLAFERHSTSKIRTINDIYHIASLGFRGEALASIASVSNVEIYSKHQAYDFGKKLILEGGRVVEESELGCPQGTTIMVKDLFFNTPARHKFLKSNNAEQSAINDIMNKLALSHPEISFKYIVGGHNVFMSPGNNNLYDVILNIYEKTLAKNLIALNDAVNEIQITGYISNIELTRGNRQYQVVFVNNRYVRSKTIDDAVALVYKTLIPHNRFPIIFLNINMDPSLVDINIHPAKTEIRFHQEGLIKDLVYKALSTELNRYNLVPNKPLNSKTIDNKESLKFYEEISHHKTLSEDSFRPGAKTLYGASQKSIDGSPSISKDDRSNDKVVHNENLSPIEGKRLGMSHKIPPNDSQEKIKILNNNLKGLLNKNEPMPTIKHSLPLVRESIFEEVVYEAPKPMFHEEHATIYDGLQYIGQIFNTYLIFEKQGQMFLMDQHAGHEKVLYEKYLEDFRTKKILSQMILEPITIQLNYMQVNKMLEHLEQIQHLGFSIEPFGEQTIVIREIPQIFDYKTAKLLIENLIDAIDFDLPEERFELSLDQIISKSCKAAIKANDRLDTIEVSSLIDQLKHLKEPYTCPHGRPIIIAIEKNELEKKFNRV